LPCVSHARRLPCRTSGTATRQQLGTNGEQIRVRADGALLTFRSTVPIDAARR